MVVRARTWRCPGAGSATANAASRVANTVLSVSHTGAVARIAGLLLGVLVLAGCGASSGDDTARVDDGGAVPAASVGDGQAKTRPRQGPGARRRRPRSPPCRARGAGQPTASRRARPATPRSAASCSEAFGTSQVVNRASLSPDGLAGVPSSAPHEVEAIIRAANAVALLPYVYGGGHARWEDSAYDCSASVSFALAAAGYLKGPLDSTSFMSWGRPGPGKWVTIFANAGPRVDDRRGPALRHERPADRRIALDGADALDVRVRAQAPAGPVSTRTICGRSGATRRPGGCHGTYANNDEDDLRPGGRTAAGARDSLRQDPCGGRPRRPARQHVRRARLPCAARQEGALLHPLGRREGALGARRGG